MLKEERFRKILDTLEEKENCSYLDFALLLSISEDTVRRDIEQLYRNGLLTKVRGGAMLRSKDPLSFQDRTSTATELKDIIGLKAQQFVKSGMTIFMDGSTTVNAITNHFPIDIQLRIVTNQPALVHLADKYRNIEFIVIGGMYHPPTATTLGADTCKEISKYLADVYFMGNCAIDHLLGSTAMFMMDAEAKRTMIKSSKEVIALADKNKLRRSEAFKVAELSEIDVLITDLASSDSELEEFRNRGIQLV